MNNHSKDLYARALNVSPGGVHSPVRAFKNVHCDPVFIEKGEQAYLYDVDGRRYVDYCMSWGPLILGHGDPDVKEAVLRAVDKGWTYGAAEEPSLTLAELMTNELPWAEKVRFVNSGTEAVMSALRLARGFTGRQKILKFDGCYHGHVDSMLVCAGSGLAEMASPDSAGVSKQTAADTLVAPLNSLGAVEEIFSQHGSDIAAIIVEPVPANNGLLLQKDGFLEEVAKIAHKAGALVIFDEVITGFRVAFGGMAAVTGINPDLVTYGKIIGGGFPVGAFAGRSEIMDHLAPLGPVYQAGTLSANPVAMSAGLATLRKLKDTNPYDSLAAATRKIGEAIQAIDSPVALHPQSFGSIFWLAIGKVDTDDGVVRSALDIPATQKEVYGQLYPEILSAGYYLAPSGFEVGFRSTVHSSEQDEGLVAAIKASLQSLER